MKSFLSVVFVGILEVHLVRQGRPGAVLDGGLGRVTSKVTACSDPSTVTNIFPFHYSKVFKLSSLVDKLFW